MKVSWDKALSNYNARKMEKYCRQRRVSVIFMNLSKAFDLINHDWLSAKLNAYYRADDTEGSVWGAMHPPPPPRFYVAERKKESKGKKKVSK